MDGDFTVEVRALAFPFICSPIATGVDVTEFPHLEALKFADVIDGMNETIDMLLGADYHYDVVYGETIWGYIGAIAVASKFGWLLTGPVKLSGTVPAVYTVANLVIDGDGSAQPRINYNHALNDALKRFWDLESLEITEPKQRNEHEFLKEINLLVRQRYDVGLPWKKDQKHLVSRDLELCTSRYRSFVTRLEKNPEILAN